MCTIFLNSSARCVWFSYSKMNTSKIKLHFDQRPWGSEIWFPRDNLAMVKILTVDPGGMLSLQYHNHREEYWRFLSGNGQVVIGEDTISVKAGDEQYVPKKTKHRIIGGTEVLVVLELHYGKFDEADIVRLEDKYGRSK